MDVNPDAAGGDGHDRYGCNEGDPRAKNEHFSALAGLPAPSFTRCGRFPIPDCRLNASAFP